MSWGTSSASLQCKVLRVLCSCDKLCFCFGGDTALFGKNRLPLDFLPPHKYVQTRCKIGKTKKPIYSGHSLYCGSCGFTNLFFVHLCMLCFFFLHSVYQSYTNLWSEVDLCFHFMILDLCFYEDLNFKSLNKREKCENVWEKSIWIV